MNTEADSPYRLEASEEEELRVAARTQWVDAVPDAFFAVPFEGNRLAVHSRGLFPDRPSYTKVRENAGGNENHFQGCQRLLGGPFLAISGGDWGSNQRKATSHLFVAELPSRPPTWWRSNLDGNGPPESDRIVARLDLHDRMWHAGGIDLCGHVLAVPVECGGVRMKKIRGVKPPECDPPRSRIVFIHVRDPRNPRILVPKIERPERKATAVALVHVPGRWYAAAVLSAAEGDEAHREKQIEFYRTEGETFSEGFGHRVRYRVPKSLRWDDYQTINLVRESSGAFFLLAMTGDHVDLFRVTLPWSGGDPALEFYAHREFKQDKSFAQFKAGVGAYASGGVLGLYAVPQWRLWDGRLRLTEWAP